MKSNHKILAALVFSALSLAACVSPSEPTTVTTVVVTDNPLVGAKWHVEDLSNRGVMDRSDLTLHFDNNGRLSGSTSCNSYNVEYTVKGNSMTVGNGMFSSAACVNPALMNQEANFMSILNDVKSFSFTNTNALVLKTADGRSITARRW